MSNATQDSRNPGNPKRRRSRGGRNRNQNNNQRSHDGRDGENRGQNRRQQGQGRTQGRQDTRPARKYSQPKLSWWQKLLKAIGLYKEPQRPARQAEAGRAKAPAEARPPKSNTRNARTGSADATRGDEGGPKKQRRKRERTGDRPRGGDASSVESARLYVGNLSYDVSESDLQDLFKGVGGVRNVEIVYNRATHRSKGYAFIEMLHVDEAKRAVEILHDQFFMGRKMNVSGAKSKGMDEREDREEERDSQPSTATRPKPADVADPTTPVAVATENPAAGDASARELTAETLNEPATPAENAPEERNPNA